MRTISRAIVALVLGSMVAGSAPGAATGRSSAPLDLRAAAADLCSDEPSFRVFRLPGLTDDDVRGVDAMGRVSCRALRVVGVAVKTYRSSGGSWFRVAKRNSPLRGWVHSWVLSRAGLPVVKLKEAAPTDDSLPDLVVTGFKPNVWEGKRCSVTQTIRGAYRAVVRNLGPGLGSSVIRVRIGSDTVVQQLTRRIRSGESVTLSGLIAGDTDVIVDPEGAIEELDESNNAARAPAPLGDFVCRPAP